MSGHTPGPWRVQGRAIAASPLDRICVTSDATDGGFVVRPRAIDGRDADTVTANARLIASAPELLDALRELVAFDAKHSGNAPIFDRARSLLARIDGDA